MTWRGGHDVVAIQTGGFTVYYSYYSNEFMYAAANMSGQTYVLRGHRLIIFCH